MSFGAGAIPDEAWLAALNAGGPGMGIGAPDAAMMSIPALSAQPPIAAPAPPPQFTPPPPPVSFGGPRRIAAPPPATASDWGGAEPELRSAMAYLQAPPTQPAAPVAAPATPPKRRPSHQAAPQSPVSPVDPNAADLERIAANGAYAPPAAPLGEPLSPQRIEADRAANLKEQEVTALREGSIRERQAQEIEDEAHANMVDAAARHVDREQRLAEVGQQLTSAKAEHDAAYQEYRQAAREGFKDYWADKSTGQKVLAGISVALGAFGASINHGPNYALEIIDGAITRDTQLRRDRIHEMSDRVAMARTGILDAERAKDELFKNADLLDAAARGATADRIAETKARMGVPMAEIETDQNIQALRAKDIDSRQKAMAAAQEKIVKTAQLANINSETRLHNASATKLEHHGMGGGGASAGLRKGEEWVADPTQADGIARDPNGQKLKATKNVADSMAKDLAEKRKASATGSKLAVMTKDAVQAIDDLTANYRDVGTAVAFGTREKREGLQDAVKLALAPLKKINVSSRTKELLNEMTSSSAFGGTTFGRGVERLDQLKRQLVREANNAAVAGQGAPAPRGGQSAKAVDPAKVKAAKDWLQQNPDDPAAADIRARLKAMGDK